MRGSHRGLADTHSPSHSFSPRAGGAAALRHETPPTPSPPARREQVRVTSCHRLPPRTGHNLAEAADAQRAREEEEEEEEAPENTLGLYEQGLCRAVVTNLTEPESHFISTDSYEGKSVCCTLLK